MGWRPVSDAVPPPPGISRWWWFHNCQKTAACYTPSASSVRRTYSRRTATCCSFATPTLPPMGSRWSFPFEGLFRDQQRDPVPRVRWRAGAELTSLSLDAPSGRDFDAVLPARAEALVAPGSASARRAGGQRQRHPIPCWPRASGRERIFGDASIRISRTGAQRRFGRALRAGDDVLEHRGRTARQLMTMPYGQWHPAGWAVD